MNKLSIPYFLLFAISLASVTALFGAEEERNAERNRILVDIRESLTKYDFNKVGDIIRNDRQDGRLFLGEGDLNDILTYSETVRDYEVSPKIILKPVLKIILPSFFLLMLTKQEFLGISRDAKLFEQSVAHMNPRAQGAASVLSLQLLKSGVVQYLNQLRRSDDASKLVRTIFRYLYL